MPEYRTGGSGDEITIKKTAIFLIEKPIFCQNMGKTGLLRSYDQEISGFLDRNPVRHVNVRSREIHEESRKGYREGCREMSRDAEKDVERNANIYSVE